MKPDYPLDPKRQTIEVLSLPMSYTETGKGRPVIAVHGLPASSYDFRWLDSAFAGRVHFYRLDLPGFGESPAAGDPQDAAFATMGATVAAFCEAADLEDVLVLGHSMGGAIAVDGATRTRRITALALVNSAGAKHHRGTFPRAYRSLTKAVDTHPVIRQIVLTAFRPIVRRVGFSDRISDDEGILAMRLCSRYDPTTFATQLRGLDKPALIAWATRDPVVEPAVSEGIIACANTREVLRFDARSHNLQKSHAVELADALVDWAHRTVVCPK